MAKFKNLKTGNIVSTTNKEAIALMQRSDRYKAVKNSNDNTTQTDGAGQPE